MNNSLSSLLDTHIFFDSSCCIGNTILDLGHAETYTVRCSRNQEPNDLSDLPSHAGSIFYQLLTDPDGVSLDNLTIDTFAVSKINFYLLFILFFVNISSKF